MLQPSVCPFNRTLVHVGCATRGHSVKVRSQSETTPPEMAVHCHHGILRPGILVTCPIWHRWCTRVLTGGLPATVASLICRHWSMQRRGNPGACTLRTFTGVFFPLKVYIPGTVLGQAPNVGTTRFSPLTPRGYRIPTPWGGAVPNLGVCAPQRACVDLCTSTASVIHEESASLLLSGDSAGVSDPARIHAGTVLVHHLQV